MFNLVLALASQAAEAAILSSKCSAVLQTGGIILAVGDWNGPLGARLQAERLHVLGHPDVCRKRVTPAAPTQFGKRVAVDGATVYFHSDHYRGDHTAT